MINSIIEYLRLRILSFVYAFRGIKVFVSGANAKIHLLITGIVMLFGFILGLSREEISLIIIVIALVIMSEIFNTSIELLVDMVSPEFSEKAGKIKDLAAAATLVCAIAATCIGLIIFVPKLKNLY